MTAETNSTDLPDPIRDQATAAREKWDAAYGAKDDASTPAASENTDAEADLDLEPAKSAASEDEWRHKYDVLRGKYDSEIRRALDESRYWQDRCGQLQAEVDRLNQARPTPAEPSLPDDLKDYLGDDAARVVAKMLADQKRELESRFGEVAAVSRQSAEGMFWSQVNAAFPDYARMQNDPDLNAWLNQPWPGQRQSRLKIAEQAVQVLDAPAFIGLLQAYAPAAAAPAKTLPTPSPTPRRAAGSGTPPPDQTTSTPADLIRQSNRIIELEQAGRYQEAQELRRKKEAAIAEGRIRAA